MKRYILQHLIKWKNSKRRKPLVLQGARQVGKTYILQYFATAEYDNHVYINFEENKKIHQFFEADIQPQKIINQMQLHFDVKIMPGKTLIIFDEIQDCPDALNSLKYFNENANQYHIVTAGSLLGVRLEGSKGFPVGKVNFLNLKPMTFFEFLEACNKNTLVDYLENIDSVELVSKPIHQQIIELLKIYYYVGGMPEAVASYIDSQDLDEVREVHKEILNAYTLDFAKHAPAHQVMKIMAILDAIPYQLAKEHKKFVFSAISKSARAREYETAIQWLIDAGIIYKVSNISVPKIPLSHYGNTNAFKVYMLDVGLLCAMSGLSKAVIVENNQLFSEFKGALTENFVAQELLAGLFEKLYYWSSEYTAEVDFIVPYESEVVPVEVKSGVSKHAKSLKAYGEKYHPKHLIRASLNNFKQDGSLINCPLYLIGQFVKYLDII